MTIVTESSDTQEVPTPLTAAPRKKLNIISVQDALEGKVQACEITPWIGTIPMTDEEFDQALDSLRDLSCH